MGLKHSFRQISKLASGTDSEITFCERLGIEWYWHNLRFNPEDEEDIQRLVVALRTLKEIGFTKG